MLPIYLEAPDSFDTYAHFDRNRTVFVAGSITGTSDWQEEVVKTLLRSGLNVFNPRRENFDTKAKGVEREQITWEHKHLEIAGITLFYFAPETVAPITLLEYGKQLVKCQYAPWRKTYVCIHPEYIRKNDVLIQTELVNPELLVCIFNNLPDMCNAIIRENA
jgi:hypothetical protein